MKKTLSIVLALVAVVAIVFAAVFAVQKNDLQKAKDDLQAQVDSLSKELADVKAAADEAARTAADEAAKAAAEAEEALKKATASYTYNGSVATFPTNWNPHQYKTETDSSTVLSWISDDFYTFDYNEAKDGYRMVPMMAVGEPVDVTADYVGEEWGIEEGAVGRAWKYTLRDDLKWQDGTPITADTFVYSVKQQLNPQAQNYRADSFYSGSVVLHNAEAYAKSGIYAYSSMLDMDAPAYVKVEDLKTEADGHYTLDGKDVAFKLDSGNNWSSNSLADYHAAASYADMFVKDGVDLFETVLEAKADKDGYVKVDKDVYEALSYIVARLHDAESVEAYAESAGDYAYQEWEEFCWLGYNRDAMDFDKVGIKALSDTELVFILDKSLQGFQLKYNLGSVPLVYEELYEKCAKVEDGVYTNNYGTSTDTTMSYGPYMLTRFQSDKEIVLEKNPNWYGYALPENEGCYQTTRIVYTYVQEASTAFEMFLNGKLDQVGLDVDHIAEYLTSDYTYRSNGPSVFAMAFNPNLKAPAENEKAAGENINKTILTLKNFRMAMSLGIDRQAFILATSPSNSPAFALYGSTIVANPEDGTFYRNYDEAKQVVVDFWGLTDEIGEGKLYATLDDAIDSITGYNLEMARDYFNKAYDEAIEKGLMDADDVVEITIGLPNTRPAYVNGYEFMVNNYTEAVKGTKLEGKLTFKQDATIGGSFGDALRNNQVDMLFYVGWNGSAFDPYNLMQAYVYPNYQYDASTDYSKEMLEIELDGVKYTADAMTWCDITNGDELEVTVSGTEEKKTLSLGYTFDEEKAQQRLLVLTKLENAVLQNYNFIPLTNDSSALLKGMKINFYTEEEVFPLGYGGVKYRTFNYTDAEWDAYVAEQGGTLNYK